MARYICEGGNTAKCVTVINCRNDVNKIKGVITLKDDTTNKNIAPWTINYNGEFHMKKQLFIISGILILCAAPCAMGCTQNNSSKSEKSDTERSTKESTFLLDKEYKTKINDITFDIDRIEVSDEVDFDNLHECSVTRQKPDQGKIIDKFSKNKEVVKKDSMDITSVDGSTGTYDYRSFADDSEVYAMDGGMGWSTAFSHKVSYSFESDDYFDKYAKEGSFDFGSIDNSLNQLVEELDKCGYELSNYDYEYFLLDYKTMQKEEKHEEKLGKELDIHSDWSVDDNCYAIYISQKEQGIPVYYGNKYFMEDTDPKMMPVGGTVSKNGVESIIVNNLYEIKEENKLIKPVDFDTCAETIANKYGQILSDSKYVVNRAKLYFVPILNEQGGYDIKLSWLFEIIKDDDSSAKEYILIDAETGKEITL